MLGKLRATCVDETLVGDGDEVRRTVVAERIPVELSKLVLVEELADAKLVRLVLQVGLGCRIVRLLSGRREPNEPDVISREFGNSSSQRHVRCWHL